MSDHVRITSSRFVCLFEEHDGDPSAELLDSLVREVIEDCAKAAHDARVWCNDLDCRGACCVRAIRSLATPIGETAGKGET